MKPKNFYVYLYVDYLFETMNTRDQISTIYPHLQYREAIIELAEKEKIHQQNWKDLAKRILANLLVLIRYKSKENVIVGIVK